MKDIKYLCSACAKKLGGIWPPIHQATWHVGICDKCEKETEISAKHNWTWSQK